MRNRLLFFLLIFISAHIFAGDYFFYYQGKKVEMKKDDSYISVKFAPDISVSQADKIIGSKVGNLMDKISIFAPGSSSSRFIIIKLKEDLSETSVRSIRNELLGATGISSVGYCFPGRGKMKHYSTNEILVKFKKNVGSGRIETVNKFYKTTIIEKAPGIDNVYLIEVNSHGEEGGDNVFDVSNKFALLSDIVEFAQPNFIREGMLLTTDDAPPPMPNDSLLGDMWHVKNTGTNIPENVIGVPGCDLNLDSAWAITTGNPNVVISIVDTGLDTNHVDIRNNLCDRSLWYDAVNNTQWPYDEYGHGTGVTGCCSAIGNNRWGTAGVAYSCKCMPVRVFGGSNAFTTDYILARGLYWAWQHGAAVINCSWGGGVPSPLISSAIYDAIHYGRNGRGTVICAGAGNDDIDTLLYPASMPEVMGIGGLSPCNQRKSLQSCDNVSPNQNWGASYGQGLSVVAPCTYIGTTELTYPFGNIPYWCICGNGTSCASPMGAGVSALIISKNGNISADSVKIIIERSAKKVGNYSYNVQNPNGLWNYEMGYGRLDARSALDMTPAGPQSIGDFILPTVSLSPPQSGVFTTNVTVNAYITDNVGVSTGSNSPRLYYYTDQNNTLQVINASLVSPGKYNFTFPRIPQSMGIRFYVAAQDDNSNTGSYPLGSRGSNPPGSQRPSKLLYFRNTSTYDTNFTATDVPIDFAAARETTLVSIFHNPVAKTILDVDCWFNINHNYDADLSMSLISPLGTEIVLSGGLGDSLQNYIGTYFDDEAIIAIDSSAVHAPYTGHFKPLQKLWFFDGENSGGDWKLKIVDNGRGDVGRLVSWGMKITYSSAGDYIQIPDKFALVGNYPNPFNPRTRILFNVPYAANIKLVLYDLTGRQVKVLLNERRGPALEDFVDVDINSIGSSNGTGLASGVYFYTMVADGNFIESKKMVLIK